MVTIYSCSFPSEVYPLVARLEVEEIPCTLANDTMISIDPLISNALGGVRLNVPEHFEERAREVVKEFFSPAATTYKPEDIVWKTDYDEVNSWCPQCEAYPVYVKKFSFGKSALAVILTLIHGISVFFFMSRLHYCASCAHQWKR